MRTTRLLFQLVRSSIGPISAKLAQFPKFLANIG
jgi:hypothetical protein